MASFRQPARTEKNGRLRSLLVLLLLASGLGQGLPAQPVIRIGAEDLQNRWVLNLAQQEGWIYSPKETKGWTRDSIDTTGWIPVDPPNLPLALADSTGLLQGWFRCKVHIDTSLAGRELFFNLLPSGAARLYVDGMESTSAGIPDRQPDMDKPAVDYLGQIGKGFTPLAVRLDTGVHTLAVYFTDHYTARLDALTWKNPRAGFSLNVFPRKTLERHVRMLSEYYFFSGIWLSGIWLLTLLFGLLLFMNPGEKALRWVALMSLALACSTAIDQLGSRLSPDALWAQAQDMLYYECMALAVGIVPLALSLVITHRIDRRLYLLLGFPLIINPIGWYLSGLALFRDGTYYLMGLVLALVGVVSISIIIRNRRRLGRAEWSLVGGLTITILWMLLHTVFIRIGFSSNAYRLATVAMIYLSLPVSFMVYIAIRFSENIAQLRKNLKDISALTDEKLRVQAEKQALVESQKERLEEEVTLRTRELQEKNEALSSANRQIEQQRDEVVSSRNELAQSLSELRAAQAQLIHSEKMASLGELTAGIAHEIKNPLNFVNNFAEVSGELFDELKDTSDPEQRAELIALLQENLAKINEHGKRADAIVKSMLQHSRTSTGEKELTDLNALADEYLRLAYHGLRAKDKAFNASFSTQLDPNLPKVDIVPQDLGRVILNLVNNAFQAVAEKKASAGPDYVPEVVIRTESVGDRVILRVTDNGPGIPDSIAGKIFQPFFTTKPTGQGTGLGLSLSYDIVKAHGGDLRVETTEGAGSTFILELPVTDS